MDHRPTFLSNAENTNYLCIIFSGGLCNFNVWLKKNFNISSTLQQYGNSKPINDTKAFFFDSIEQDSKFLDHPRKPAIWEEKSNFLETSWPAPLVLLPICCLLESPSPCAPPLLLSICIIKHSTFFCPRPPQQQQPPPPPKSNRSVLDLQSEFSFKC